MALLLLLPGLASAGANTSNTTNTITLGSIHGAHTLGPVEVIYDWWRDHCMDGKCVAVRACRYHLPCRHSPLDKASVHQCITTLSSPVWARSAPAALQHTPFCPTTTSPAIDRTSHYGSMSVCDGKRVGAIGLGCAGHASAHVATRQQRDHADQLGELGVPCQHRAGRNPPWQPRICSRTLMDQCPLESDASESDASESDASESDEPE